MYKTSFKSLPPNCPVLPKKYSAMNITIVESFGGNLVKGMTVGELPNGIYRNVIKFENEKDENILTIMWQTEIYIRMNDDRF
jgi:hypothetical protein